MDSKVTVTIYTNLQCGDCTVFDTLLNNELLPKYSVVALVMQFF